MKVGVFDSGMGGLIVTHSIIQELPQYDYLFLGDTARVPYGSRSPEAIYRFTKEGVRYLFQQDCEIVIVACNTASADALRHLQQDYLPEEYPDCHLLGVLVPTAEAAVAASHNHQIGVLATEGTVASGAFEREIHKLQPDAQVLQQAAPLLVPLVEYSGSAYAPAILRDYLKPLLAAGVDTLVLGCTHYPFFRDEIKKQVGEQVKVIGQDELMPRRLADYLQRHPETEQLLSRAATRSFVVTDLTPSNQALASLLFDATANLKPVSLVA
ncbi:MAG TPA: glutamate racemase [Candidatus Saccharimonadales bacterium]|nr:glutamate racemase [Candidatus Saccharimonadales bacterium]